MMDIIQAGAIDRVIDSVHVHRMRWHLAQHTVVQDGSLTPVGTFRYYPYESSQHME